MYRTVACKNLFLTFLEDDHFENESNQLEFVLRVEYRWPNRKALSYHKRELRHSILSASIKLRNRRAQLYHSELFNKFDIDNGNLKSCHV